MRKVLTTLNLNDVFNKYDTVYDSPRAYQTIVNMIVVCRVAASTIFHPTHNSEESQTYGFSLMKVYLLEISKDENCHHL